MRMLKRMEIRLLDIRMLFLERFLATVQKVGLIFGEVDGQLRSLLLMEMRL